MAETGETDDARPPEKSAEVKLIWDRVESETHLPKKALTHQQIAEAAVTLADAEGLEAVTMRKLAERLGVATMALYRYVANKDELYELMVNEAAYDDADRLEDGVDWYWRIGLHKYAQATRTAAIRHPWLMSASSSIAGTLTPRRLAATERALNILAATGLDQTALLGVLRIVESYVRGAVATEVSQRSMLIRLDLSPDSDPRIIYSDHMKWALDSGRFPKLDEVIKSGAGEPNLEGSEFEIGLDCLLDGIAARYGLA